jgi:hypothetical protein
LMAPSVLTIAWEIPSPESLACAWGVGLGGLGDCDGLRALVGCEVGRLAGRQAGRQSES